MNGGQPSCSDLPISGGSGNEPKPPWQRRTSVWRKATILHDGGQPSCSDLPISGGPGLNPSHHGSDEQMFGAKQQVLGTGQTTKKRNRK